MQTQPPLAEETLETLLPVHIFLRVIKTLPEVTQQISSYIMTSPNWIICPCLTNHWQKQWDYYDWCID